MEKTQTTRMVVWPDASYIDVDVEGEQAVEDALLWKSDDFRWVDVAVNEEGEPCELCIRYAASGGPGHEGSRFCKSHGIAAGGFRAHCTCDTCW